MPHLHQVLREVEYHSREVAGQVHDHNAHQDDGTASGLPLLPLHIERIHHDHTARLDLLEDEDIDDKKGDEGEDAHE